MQADAEDGGVVLVMVCVGVVLDSGSRCLSHTLSRPYTVLLCGQADMSWYSRSLSVLERRERVGVQTERLIHTEFKSSESVTQRETTSKIIFKRMRATKTGCVI